MGQLGLSSCEAVFRIILAWLEVASTPLLGFVMVLRQRYLELWWRLLWLTRKTQIICGLNVIRPMLLLYCFLLSYVFLERLVVIDFFAHLNPVADKLASTGWDLQSFKWCSYPPSDVVPLLARKLSSLLNCRFSKFLCPCVCFFLAMIFSHWLCSSQVLTRHLLCRCYARHVSLGMTLWITLTITMVVFFCSDFFSSFGLYLDSYCFSFIYFLLI